MKNLLFVALLGVALYHYWGRKGGGGEAMSRFVISESTPVQKVSPDKRIRVILFTGTEWCGACQQLASSVISKPGWKEFAANELVFHEIDVPVDRSRVKSTDQALISKYGVSGYPTMVVLDRTGKELSRQVGSGPPLENYKDWIRRHAKHYGG